MVVKVRKGVNSKKRTSVVEQGMPVAGEENQVPNVPSTAPAVNKQNKVQQNDTPPATQEDPNEILEEVFHVENILDKKIIDGIIHYKVKWLGYDDPNDDTWEPIDNCHCKDLLDKYEEEHAGEPVQREFINMKAPTKKRGKKRKNVSNGQTTTQTTNAVAVPFVEKDSYLLQQGRKLSTIMGMSRLPPNGTGKLMVLVLYDATEDEPEVMEYVPAKILADDNAGQPLDQRAGSKMIASFLLQRVSFLE